MGTKPLVILDVLLCCGCTKAEWSKKPLMVGDSSQIVINYDTEIRGEFYRSTDIISNSKEKVKKSLSGAL